MAEMTIHEACRRGDVEAVRALLAADPAAVDADDEHGWRPVFHAGLWRHEEVVRLLIEAGADLAAHEGYVMHYAGEVPNNKAIVARLVQYGALDAHVRPADDLARQFLAAVFLADTARAQALLARHPHLATTPDGRGDQPIHHAARNGDTEIVRLLLEHGADANATSRRGHTRVVLCRRTRSSGNPPAAPEKGSRPPSPGRAPAIPWPVSKRLPLHADCRSITATHGGGLKLSCGNQLDRVEPEDSD